MSEHLHIKVRLEDGALWATVEQYPGVFATGDTLEELRASLEEGISLYLSEPGASVSVKIAALESEPMEATAQADLAFA